MAGSDWVNRSAWSDLGCEGSTERDFSARNRSKHGLLLNKRKEGRRSGALATMNAWGRTPVISAVELRNVMIWEDLLQ